MLLLVSVATLLSYLGVCHSATTIKQKGGLGLVPGELDSWNASGSYGSSTRHVWVNRHAKSTVHGILVTVKVAFEVGCAG